MNENNREYVSLAEEGGSINISEDVIGSIAAIAVAEVEGVAGLAGSQAAEFLTRKSAPKGIRIIISDNSVRVDCYILMKYGSTIPEVAKAVQDAVASAVESMTGMKVAAVNVSVGGIVFEKEPKRG